MPVNRSCSTSESGIYRHVLSRVPGLSIRPPRLFGVLCLGRILPRRRPPAGSGTPSGGLLGQQSDDITRVLLASWLVRGPRRAAPAPPIANRKPRLLAVLRCTSQPRAYTIYVCTKYTAYFGRGARFFCRKRSCGATGLQFGTPASSVLCTLSVTASCGEGGSQRGACFPASILLLFCAQSSNSDALPGPVLSYPGHISYRTGVSGAFASILCA
jgi:hypothetical protein